MKTKLFALHILIPALLFFHQKASAQNENIGIGTTSPERSSILDISSTTKGVLLPRMTLEQRNAIVLPVAGLLIYQTDIAPGFYYYLGGWQPISASVATLANRTLSNLKAPTALNEDLLPGNSASLNLGSSSLSWRDIYFFGDVFLQGNRFITSRGTNSFFGHLAGNPSVTGFYNTASGYTALTANITGNWNTANGYQALLNTNNGHSNTATGFQALIANTGGTYNTATGVLALANNSTGAGNSATGVGALNLSTGNHNSGIGYSSGGNFSSGNNNTFLGAFADGPVGVPISNATAIGYQAEVTGSNSIKAGNTAVTSIGGYAGWTTFPSDGRFKRNVKENVPGLEFIKQLRAVTYNVDVDAIDKRLQANFPVKRADALGNKHEASAEELRAKKEKALVVYSGFIAQEVEQAAKRLGYNFSGLDAPKNSNDFYGIRYAEFVVPLVKAVQELNEKIDYLQKENGLLKSSHTQTMIVKQQAQIDRQQLQIETLTALMLEMKKEMATLKASTDKRD